MKKIILSTIMFVAAVTMICGCNSSEAEAPQKQIGIQLYSARQAYSDIEATLAKVAESGYTAVETLGGPSCFGLEAADFKALCDKYGLRIASTHAVVPYNPADLEATMEGWRKLFEGLKIMGAKYCVIPGMSFGSTLAEIDACCAFHNKVGEVAKEYGLLLGYHNHKGDFAQVEGQTILDYVIAHTDADKFFIELDVCKTNMGDVDPMHYLKTYGDRIKVLHAKDEGVLGTSGDIDFKQIFETFYANGAIDCFVEYELPFEIGEDAAENERNLAAMWQGIADCCNYLQEADFVRSCEY